MKKVIDLFAGCGGLSLGFEQNGYTVTKAVEFDPYIAETYRVNHPETKLIVDDIKNVDNSGEFSEKEASVIIGGPPCQGFSMSGARIRGGFVSDPRNFLFKHYFNVVKTVMPKVFVFENVKGILTMEKGEIFQEIIKLFSDENNFGGKKYNLYYKVFKAVEFGIPQSRERVIIIGVLDKEIDFEGLQKIVTNKILSENSSYFNNVTVWDAISNLPDSTVTGEIDNPKAETEYQRYLSCDKEKLYNHISTKHNNKAIDRMKKIKENENFAVLDEKINSVHSGSYGRLAKDGVAPTITTRFDTPSGGRFIHPVYDRTITPREAARIQSFPDDFIFTGTKSSICKQIGNAVPPKISYYLAKLVEEVLLDYER